MEQIREILTPDQAAAYLQVNRETIYRYIRDGRLVASRLGRAYRIPRQSVERLLWSTRIRGEATRRDIDNAALNAFWSADRLPTEEATTARQADNCPPSAAEAHAIVERTAGLFRHAAGRPPATIAEETAAFEQGVADEVMRGTGG